MAELCEFQAALTIFYSAGLDACDRIAAAEAAAQAPAVELATAGADVDGEGVVLEPVVPKAASLTADAKVCHTRRNRARLNLN